LCYANYVNILGGGVHTIKENAEILLVASKEIGLDVNVDKTKYIEAARSRFDPRNCLYYDVTVLFKPHINSL
jgi:hypothetical protein